MSGRGLHRRGLAVLVVAVALAGGACGGGGEEDGSDRPLLSGEPPVFSVAAE